MGFGGKCVRGRGERERGERETERREAPLALCPPRPSIHSAIFGRVIKLVLQPPLTTFRGGFLPCAAVEQRTAQRTLANGRRGLYDRSEGAVNGQFFFSLEPNGH